MKHTYPAWTVAAIAAGATLWLAGPVFAQGARTATSGASAGTAAPSGSSGGSSGGGSSTSSGSSGGSSGGSHAGGGSSGSSGGHSGGGATGGGYSGTRGSHESNGGGARNNGGTAARTNSGSNSGAASSAGSGGTASNGGAVAHRGGQNRATILNSDGSPSGVPAYSRPRSGGTPVGTAVPRGTTPTSGNGTTGGYYYPGYGGYYGGYYDPWWFGSVGAGLGYGTYGSYYGGYYDPWYGGDPGYAGGGGGGGFDLSSPQSSYRSSNEDGKLRLKIKPRNAEVYVDGYFVGVVDDFDGIFQRLHIESGPHRVEVRAPGYESLAFDVRISPDHSTTYEGELKRIR